MHRLLACLLIASNAGAIDVRIYSEFHQTGAMPAREVLSPGVVRNAFATFRVVVTGPPNTFYFMAVQTNPADIFQIRLYREIGFVSPIEERNVSFLAGVIPPGATTNSYLLDLWVPADVRPGPTRVEVLAKTADWKVAPMEVRILPVTVPALPVTFAPFPTTNVFETLLIGPQASPSWPSDMRNAGRESALLSSLDTSTSAEVRIATLIAYFESEWMYIRPRGSESYLTVRQLLYRLAAIRQARRGTPQHVPD